MLSINTIQEKYICYRDGTFTMKVLNWQSTDTLQFATKQQSNGHLLLIKTGHNVDKIHNWWAICDTF